jgi:hypothetical protein
MQKFTQKGLMEFTDKLKVAAADKNQTFFFSLYKEKKKLNLIFH